MRICILCIAICTCLYAHAQPNHPAAAELISPSGSQTHTLTKGKGIWCSTWFADSATLRNSKTQYYLTSGFVYWCRFTAQDPNAISLILRSMDTRHTSGGRLDACYLDFIIYRYDGKPDAFEKEIQDTALTPCRVGSAFLMPGNYTLDGSGLSDFDTATTTRTSASGYLLPLQEPAGTQFYMVVQVVCYPNAPKCELQIDPGFNLCFDGACVPHHLVLSGTPVRNGIAKINTHTSTLDHVVEVLNADSTLSLNIIGFSDNSNAVTRDSTYGAQRAKAVYDYLIKKGISSSRLLYRSKGSSQPIAPNVLPEDRDRNCRVELIFYRKKK